MKLVKKTDEYSVYLKRSGRYGVKSTDGKWINGVSKIRILLDEDLVKTTLPPEPEAVPDEPVDDTEVAMLPDQEDIEDDSPKNNDADADDSEPDEPATDEPAKQDEESSSEAEEDSGTEDPPPTDQAANEDDSPSDVEDTETSSVSDTSDDTADTDTTDEEEPEAVEDPEAKEP